MNRARWMTRKSWGVALLVIASVPILFVDLGTYGLVNGDEAFYHDVARTMVESGDWTRIEFAGQHRVYDTFTHAPLFLWLKAVVIMVLGDSYWSMRAVSAGFAMITVLVVYAFGLRLMSAGFALLAALLQLTTYQFVYLHSGRTGEMEPLIACFALLAPLLLIRALERGTSLVPHHLCLVVLLNLKAAFILIPLLAEMLYFAFATPHRARLRDWLRDSLWVLPLGAAWHFYHLAIGWEPFLDTLETLSRQALGDAAGGSRLEGLRERVLVNSEYYLQTLSWGGFPSSLLYPVAVLVFVAPGGAHEERHRWRLLGCYALVVWAYYSIVTLQHTWYIIPLYAYLALALARWLSRLAAGDLSRASLALTSGLLALLPWIRIEWLSFDPFVKNAVGLNPRVEWVGTGGLPSWLCATLTLVVVPACVWLLPWLRGRGTGTGAETRAGVGVSAGRGRQAFAVVCGTALVSVGAARVVTSLEHTDHVSRLEQFARDLEAHGTAGKPFSYPIKLPRGSDFETRFLFHRDYKLKMKTTRRFLKKRHTFVLVGPRDPNSGAR